MGFLSGVTSVIKGVGNALAGTVSVIGGLLSEGISRILGLGGFFLDLIGVRIQKKLKIKFIILTDTNGAELVPQSNIDETFKLTKRILDEQADITLIQRGIFIAFGAPAGALDVTTPTKSFFGLWGEVGTFFNGLAGYGPFTRMLSVIIVNTLEGDDGRSFGPASNFVLVEKHYFINPKKPNSIVAHEIGHACGLIKHRKRKVNLMHKPDSRGEHLTRWQISWMRGSKFLWYF